MEFPRKPAAKKRLRYLLTPRGVAEKTWPRRGDGPGERAIRHIQARRGARPLGVNYVVEASILVLAAHELLAGRLAAPAFRDRIALDDVSFDYGGERVLDHVSLEIQAGEVVAIVGPSGVGKSTLADLILRLYDPVQGTITIDGVDLRTLRQAEHRRLFGVVFQDALLFHGSIRENIAYGWDGLWLNPRESGLHNNHHAYPSRSKFNMGLKPAAKGPPTTSSSAASSGSPPGRPGASGWQCTASTTPSPTARATRTARLSSGSERCSSATSSIAPLGNLLRAVTEGRPRGATKPYTRLYRLQFTEALPLGAGTGAEGR